MDGAIFRSLDELLELALISMTAIAAMVVGLALVVDGTGETFLDRLKQPRNAVRHFAALWHSFLIPATDETEEAGHIGVGHSHRPLWAETAAVPPTIDSPSRRYTLVSQLGRGDLADVHTATADGREFVLKITRPPAAGPLLVGEARRLAMLAARSGDRHCGEYFPRLVESFAVRVDGERRHANVFAHRPGFFTLEEVRGRHAAGLDARHLAWVFKRMLASLGFAHRCGLVHGAVLPPHVMIHAEDHGLRLLDWIHAVPIGGILDFVPAAYRDWHPREAFDREPAGPTTDIYLASKCLIYLAGGEPVAERWPASVPEPMRRFVATCLYPAARMRPQDAWKLHEEFDELLQRLFGVPKYHPLVMA